MNADDRGKLIVALIEAENGLVALTGVAHEIGLLGVPADIYASVDTGAGLLKLYRIFRTRLQLDEAREVKPR